ncbi:triose-phosphate isomerase [Candidatus Riesia pediculicola]|uniref:Triosephosphate isomerase n=1 Tax=Riesia pediculicola (strain USDA) TaxID=515618 RepID=D4G8H0_RIEPU|nr:triose-phosphate isomerase [Candidatus Riesia pediculicola]ADD79866.1 triosephosphate isomerase [Candidatus Riesia pediculicola USDA]ARC53853.1 hypothetical protein AOE55_01680 [Candidatus Riesia pediculicola]QOJ86485.1 triose-phosphate isomerase [Candidatus Riesia pediculicola]
MKRKIIVGNWKLNGSFSMIEKFFKNLKTETLKSSKYDLILAPPFPYLIKMKEIMKKYSNIFLGAQNVDIHSDGPYTGEVSSSMLRDVGVKYTIIGHSERRKYHQENDRMIKRKILSLQKENIIPISCIGESLEEKELKKTESVLIDQVKPIIDVMKKNCFEEIVIAYEPIWSIGTGKVADSNSIQRTSNFIKKYVHDRLNIKEEKLSIIYGGSVDSMNFQKFIREKDIDGLLIGKSSIDCRSISEILSFSGDFLNVSNTS